MRTAIDMSPLYGSMVGVDRIQTLIDAALKTEGDLNAPPYNIEKSGDDSYRIELAATGFSPAELQVTAQPNLLIVAGRKAETNTQRTFLHHGVRRADFEVRFELADYVVVKSADYTDGMLKIDLAREVPEGMKPRRIAITTAEPPRIGAPEPQKRITDATPDRRAT